MPNCTTPSPRSSLPTRLLCGWAVAGQTEVGVRVERSSAWVKDELSGFSVTPGRLLLGLGLLCCLLGARQKRRTVRRIMVVVGLLLLAVGLLLLAVC